MSIDAVKKFGRNRGRKTTTMMTVIALGLLVQAASDSGWLTSGHMPLVFAMVGGVAASLLAAYRIARRVGDDPTAVRVRRRRTYAIMR